MADTWGCAICQQSHPTSVTVCPNTAASIVFRSRRTVEAVPWLGDQRNYPGHWRWQSAIERDAPSEEAKAGDWIVYDRDNRGRSCLRPVPDSAFRAAYEPVAPSPPETPAPEGGGEADAARVRACAETVARVAEDGVLTTWRHTIEGRPCVLCDEHHCTCGIEALAGAVETLRAGLAVPASPASAPRETPDPLRDAVEEEVRILSTKNRVSGVDVAERLRAVLARSAPPEAPASAPSPALVLAEGETIAASCARCGGAFRVGILSHPCMKTSAPASSSTNPDPEVKP